MSREPARKVPEAKVSTAVLYTDLDGTLLDYDGYGWAPAASALGALRAHGVAVVPCSSKTLPEQRDLAEAMGIRGPFIVENGSAVVVPRGYFPDAMNEVADRGTVRATPEHWIVELGVTRSFILDVIGEVRTREGIAVRGYADMTVEEIRMRTGLPEPEARRAAKRDFSETVYVAGGPAEWGRFIEALLQRGLHCFGNGPSGTVVGVEVDKGRPVRMLTALYRRAGGVASAEAGLTPVALRTAAVGDAPNDESMLQAVDRAFLVERPGGGWAQLDVEGLTRMEGVGPVGWARVATRILEEMGVT